MGGGERTVADRLEEVTSAHRRASRRQRQWGDQYAAPDGPPISLTHKNCGDEAHANLVCSECGEPMDARSVRAVAGEGRWVGEHSLLVTSTQVIR